MAFTINFGNDDTEENIEKKKLSLRDGIRRFAPTKKTREKTTQNVTANVVTNVTPTSTSPSPAVVRLPANTNEFVDRKVEKSTESKMTTKRVVVDRENNIESNVVVTTRDDRDARAGDAASEAGTYTIDQVRSFD
jgi:hypothetical protein